MEEKDKLYLMLEEFRALKSEEMERTRLEHQLYAVGVALGMGLATAGVFAHRPLFFLFLIIGTALLAGIPIALLQHEISAVSARLREIEYQMNTRTSDRIFARESDRTPLRVHADWIDRDALRRNWWRLRLDSRRYAKRWRTGVRQFRETVRGRPQRREPFRTETPDDRLGR